jgi:phosphate starvation-inducible protein PhoH
MANKRNGNTPHARGQLGARFPAMDQTTPTVNVALGTVNAAEPNDANYLSDANDPNVAMLIGKTTAGKTKLATRKVHTLMIAKDILLCGLLMTRPWSGTLISRIGQR